MGEEGQRMGMGRVSVEERGMEEGMNA